MAMIIALLGGAFNPPHIGHIMIAQQVLDFTDTDEVWFVPAYQHTFCKPMAAVEDRMNMTKLLIDSSTDESLRNKIRVSSLEIDNKLDGNTIHLLPRLPREHSYRFIIGSDNLPTFHLWGSWQELLDKLPFFVFPRYGYPNEPFYEHMSTVNDPSIVVTNISSTKIRDRAQRGLAIGSFVSKDVASYIEKKGLYRS